MTEAKRYVDLLIVKSGEELFVAEADSTRVHTGGMVEIEPVPGTRVIGEVIDDAIFDEVGGERYRDDDNVLRAELTSDEQVSDIISWIDEESSLFELDVGDNIITATDDGGGTSLTAQFTFSPAVVALYES